MHAEIKKTTESSTSEASSAIERYLSRRYRSRKPDEAGMRTQEKNTQPIPERASRTVFPELPDDEPSTNPIVNSHPVCKPRRPTAERLTETTAHVANQADASIKQKNIVRLGLFARIEARTRSRRSSWRNNSVQSTPSERRRIPPWRRHAYQRWEFACEA